MLSTEMALVTGITQCVCLVDDFGNRTMRPCLSSAVKLQVHYSLKSLLCLLCFVV